MLTDKLQYLTMPLQPAPQSSEEPVHKTMQAYTDTLHATQKELHYSPSPIHIVTEATTLEDPPHALLLATGAAHATLQPMDTCIMITTGIVAPHSTLTISPISPQPCSKISPHLMDKTLQNWKTGS